MGHLGLELTECTSAEDADGQDLEDRIEGTDLFVLCWSEAASRSEMVRREVGYVLSRGSEGLAVPVIHPVAVGSGPLPGLWDEIAHLQFTAGLGPEAQDGEDQV